MLVRTGMILSACLNGFDHLKGVFWSRCQNGFEQEMFAEWSKKKDSWKRSVCQLCNRLRRTRQWKAYYTLTRTDRKLWKTEREIWWKENTTIFALPQVLKRPSGLAFSSHRFTMTQEGGNNTHFPSFCFPRDMFFFYILSSFLSSIFCLLLLWVASHSLTHNEQEDTLSPERKTQGEHWKKRTGRKKMRTERMREGKTHSHWTSIIFRIPQMLNGLKRSRERESDVWVAKLDV